MQVNIDQYLENELVSQLRDQVNSASAFNGLVFDFNDLQNYCSELQHRNSILDKEGTMLREENVTLRQDLEEAKRIAEKGEAAEEFERKAKELEEINSITLRDHVKTLEDLVKCQAELKQKTLDKEQLEEDIEKSNKQNVELRQQLDDLANQLQLEKDALQEATAELEERLRQKEQALTQVDELSVEKRNLEQRMVELKVEIANKRRALDEEQDSMEKMKKQIKELLNEAEKDREIVQVDVTSEEGVGEPPTLANAAPELARGSNPLAIINSLWQQRNNLLGRNSVPSQLNGSSLIDQIRQTMEDYPAMMSLVPHVQVRELEAHPGTCFGLCFTKNGSFVASCGIDRVVKTWDPDSGHHQNTYTGVQAGINDVAFSEDQQLVLGASTDKSVQVWDKVSCRGKFTLNGHQEKVWTVSCSPLDSSKAVSGGADRCIKVWDIRRGQISQNIMCASTCHSVKVTQDGTQIVSGHFDGGVRFWDMRSAKQVHEMKQVHSEAVTGVVASNKSHQILTLGRDQKLKLIQQLGFNEIMTYEDIDFNIGKEMIRPCFSSDDSYVAAGTADGKIYIWEAENGNLRTVLGQHDHGVVSVAWSPTGRQLVSADNKGIIKFWK